MFGFGNERKNDGTTVLHYSLAEYLSLWRKQS